MLTYYETRVQVWNWPFAIHTIWGMCYLSILWLKSNYLRKIVPSERWIKIQFWFTKMCSKKGVYKCPPVFPFCINDLELRGRQAIRVHAWWRLVMVCMKRLFWRRCTLTVHFLPSKSFIHACPVKADNFVSLPQLSFLVNENIRVATTLSVMGDSSA